MKDDIVERLRAIPVWMVGMIAPGWQEHGTAAYEAADEIERLRRELERLNTRTLSRPWGD